MYLKNSKLHICVICTPRDLVSWGLTLEYEHLPGLFKPATKFNIYFQCFLFFLFFSHSAALEDVRSRHHHRRSHHHYAHHAKETSATDVEKAIPTSSIHTNVTSVKVMPLTEGKGLSIYYVSTCRGRSGLLVRSLSVRWSSSVLPDFNLLGPLAH